MMRLKGEIYPTNILLAVYMLTDFHVYISPYIDYNISSSNVDNVLIYLVINYTFPSTLFIAPIKSPLNRTFFFLSFAVFAAHYEVIKTDYDM